MPKNQSAKKERKKQKSRKVNQNSIHNGVSNKNQLGGKNKKSKKNKVPKNKSLKKTHQVGGMNFFENYQPPKKNEFKETIKKIFIKQEDSNGNVVTTKIGNYKFLIYDIDYTNYDVYINEQIEVRKGNQTASQTKITILILINKNNENVYIFDGEYIINEDKYFKVTNNLANGYADEVLKHIATKKLNKNLTEIMVLIHQGSIVLNDETLKNLSVVQEKINEYTDRIENIVNLIIEHVLIEKYTPNKESTRDESDFATIDINSKKDRTTYLKYFFNIITNTDISNKMSDGTLDINNFLKEANLIKKDDNSNILEHTNKPDLPYYMKSNNIDGIYKFIFFFRDQDLSFKLLRFTFNDVDSEIIVYESRTNTLERKKKKN